MKITLDRLTLSFMIVIVVIITTITLTLTHYGHIPKTTHQNLLPHHSSTPSDHASHTNTVEYTHSNHAAATLDTTAAGMTHVSDEKITLTTAAISHLPVHGFTPGLGHAGHITVNSSVYEAPFDLWVTGKTFNVTNADFYNLHHANLFRPDLRSRTCEGIYWRDMLSIGSDTMYQNAFNLPDGYAVFVPAGSPLQLDVMFHNPETENAQDLYNVQGSIDLKLAAPDQISDIKIAEYIRLELTDSPCLGDNKSFVFTVPANTEEYIIGQEYSAKDPFVHTFTQSGKIIYAGGHVHGWEGGQKLDIFLNDRIIIDYQTKKVSDHPFKYKTAHRPESINVKAGDVLRLEATYTNPSNNPIPGAMGMFGMFFAAD